MSLRWGSIEQSTVFYKTAAPLELKGRTAKQIVAPPRRTLLNNQLFSTRMPLPWRP